MYVQFKIAYKTEEYIKINLYRSERSILAQFRCGVLPETDKRLCTFCNLRVPEDGTHFLLHCSFYDNERNYYFKEVLDSDQWVTSLPKDKLCTLVCVYARKTAKYLLSVFIKRLRKELYNS